MGAGESLTPEMLEEAFGAVNNRFLTAARNEGFDIAEVHHWNFNKGSFPTQIVDSRNLVPVSSRDIHTWLHEMTTMNPGNIWAGPVAPEYILQIPDWATHLPKNGIR